MWINWKERSVLVTGGTAGIGLAFAKNALIGRELSESMIEPYLMPRDSSSWLKH